MESQDSPGRPASRPCSAALTRDRPGCRALPDDEHSFYVPSRQPDRDTPTAGPGHADR